jgi:hypothetical protein
MKLVKSKDINRKKWNELVKKNQGSLFFRSEYLDLFAKNWMIYVDESYSKGAAFIYNEQFKVKIIYPSFYQRNFEFYELSKEEIKNCLLIIQEECKIGQIYSEFENLALNHTIKTARKYQILDKESNFNILANRMLKKAEKGEFEIKNCYFEALKPILEAELIDKIPGFDLTNSSHLQELFDIEEIQSKIYISGIYKQDILKGGMVFIIENSKIIYLIGASDAETKKNGGMYHCMNQAINLAKKTNFEFDFGGSNIDSIRQFYLNLGGSDKNYYAYSWDKTSLIFKLIRKIYKRIKG